MPGLDLKQYMGRWYATESFDAPYQAFAQCITANYTLQPSGDVRVLNQGVTGLRVWGKLWFKQRSVADGFARVPDKSNPGALQVQFGGPAGDDIPNYLLLETDYKEYALVWSCVNVLGGVFTVDTAWILSRTPVPPRQTEMLKAKLRSYGIDTGYFRKIYHDDCKL